MSHTDMSRRGLLKTSFLGAAAAGATGFGLSSQAQAKQAANAQTYDAVVLGAGPAGLIAAITAHDAGAKVVVLEKRDRPEATPSSPSAPSAAGARATRPNRASRTRLTTSMP